MLQRKKAARRRLEKYDVRRRELAGELYAVRMYA
jgi:hypothetical protein